MEVFLPRSLEEALALKAEHPDAVPVAGGTDLWVAVNFGTARPPALLDLSRVGELKTWSADDGRVRLGAGVTFARIEKELAEFRPLAEASRSVGSPQIRNRATIGGNLATASPAGDSIPVLAAYGATVVVASRNGERSEPWDRFFTGPKRTTLAPDELIVGVEWQRVDAPGSFAKVGTRNAMVIAIAGLCLQLDPACAQRQARARLRGADGRPRARGGVVRGRRRRVGRAGPPPAGRRGRGVRTARGGRGASDRRHPLLGGVPAARGRGARAAGAPLDTRRLEGCSMKIRTTVNGVEREADAWPGSSLLTFLRDDLGLVGSKNACEQGECGSCSVWLDGDVVCSCLVPAVQADGAVVKTVEALADGGALHAVQEAFLAAGAVQCGFCTPGMVVTAADLLERDPDPSDETIREALAGNLCRCTGYGKIVDAVHLAAKALA